MRRRVLDWLACPSCRVAFTLEDERTDGEHIVSGWLSCGGCRRRHPVRRGIPRILPDRMTAEAAQTVRQFGAQWTLEFPETLPGHERQFQDWIAPVQPSFFEGKVVLDAGCGMGRYSTLASQYGAREVLGVDLSDSVDTAYERTKHLPNVHIIQADLTCLPVRQGGVDYAFSIGVLHHTSDPRGSFLSMARCVTPGGRLSAWVYAREGNGWVVKLVSPVRQGLTSRLPPRALYGLSWALTAVLLYPALKLVYRPLNRWAPGAAKHLFYNAYLSYISQFGIRNIALIVYDHLTPSIAQYIRREEFEDWFRAAGLGQAAIAWHNRNSWRGTAVAA